MIKNIKYNSLNFSVRRRFLLETSETLDNSGKLSYKISYKNPILTK